MFGWFQRLLPRTGDFFGMFEAHAATLVEAAEALSLLADDDSSTSEQLKIINAREHDADDIIREVLTTVRRTFLTPFDRGAITSLIASMDDAIDEMQTTARAIDLYELQQLQPEMKEMVKIAVECAALTAEVMPLLRDIGRNGSRIHLLTEKLVSLEGEADDVHAAGLKTAFQQHGETNTIKFIVAREIFKHLERVVDAFEDVANEIDGIVIDHA
jgi:predicted phosphate transport protein (TIGR00153 family)